LIIESLRASFLLPGMTSLINVLVNQIMENKETQRDTQGASS
jgi:hypothetical protein